MNQGIARKLMLVVLLLIVLTGCAQADVASRNISTAADNFEISRRIVFYNSITDTYILTVEGLCSLGNYDQAGELSVTCKIGPNRYYKHFLGLSDNVTYVAEQIESDATDVYHYRVIFRPSVIVPRVEVNP